LEIANKIIKSELIDWRNLEWLQGKLKAIPENSLKKLKQSLINNSFVQPFNVWDNGKLWILDGHHRKLAMEQLEAEGYTIPDRLPANFVQCKDKKEASKMVLLYSSIYAKADEQSLEMFLAENLMSYEDIKTEIDIPNINESFFDLDPNSLDDAFSLKDGDREPIQQMTFTLADKQCEFIKDAMKNVTLETDNFGNENGNGNKLYAIVKQWAEQKKS